MIRIVCCFGVWVDGGVVGRAIGRDERNEDSRDAFFHLIWLVLRTLWLFFPFHSPKRQKSSDQLPISATAGHLSQPHDLVDGDSVVVLVHSRTTYLLSPLVSFNNSNPLTTLITQSTLPEDYRDQLWALVLAVQSTVRVFEIPQRLSC